MSVGKMLTAKRLPSISRMILFTLLIICVFTACTRSASKAPSGSVNNTGSAPRVSITNVQVNQGAGVYITGQSSLPDGECVKTELLANKKAVDWWPRDVCIEVSSGYWEMLVALGHNGAPKELEPNHPYEIHAWWSKHPEETSTRFPFSLTGTMPAP